MQTLRRLNLSLVLLALVFTIGCAARSVRHTATVSVVTAHATLSTIQDTADLVVCGRPFAPPAGQCLTPEDRAQKVAPKLSRAFSLDEQVARTVRALPAGEPQPGEVSAALVEIGKLVDEVLALLPSSKQKATLVNKLGGV